MVWYGRYVHTIKAICEYVYALGCECVAFIAISMVYSSTLSMFCKLGILSAMWRL